ncbi:hypothetical protein EDB85DRAFT_1846211, partial [Lactarius pseudohatsudake]
VVLGRYVSEHNHELGADNMVYTRLSDSARQQMKLMLVQKVDTQEIVRSVRATAPDGSHNKFVDFSDVSRIARALDAETIRLHPEDGISM